jgi:hypothetical protein
MTIEQAWQRYLEDCEQMRQLFLQDPMSAKYPLLRANAHFLLLQTQAMAYNLVMAPRQDSPVFTTHHFFEPPLYTAHQPNPDFCYQLAFLNGARRWRITGQRNSAHWVDIQASRGWWGEPGYDALGNYDLDELEIRSDGSFEIIASAEPAPGNWIRLDGAHRNNTLLVRAAMYDWEREVPPELRIEPLEVERADPMIHTEDEIIRRLELCGAMIRHSIGRWTTRASPGLLKRVGMNQPFTHRGEPSRGGANPHAQYGQIVYELGPDEALIIETENPEAAYWGISLGTWWWETIDATHHKTSINGQQAVLDSDGKFRAVLSRQDPGVPNWLDPVCWDVGIILVRWYRAAREQRIITRKILSSELRNHLPPDTPVVTSEQRRAEIERRRQAVLRWYGYNAAAQHGTGRDASINRRC